MNTALAISQLREFGARLARIDSSGWAKPTPLPGWDVTALARHVGAVAWQQAEAFHRARQQIGEAPAYAELRCPEDDLPEAVDESRRHLEAAIRNLDLGRDPAVPLPFATLPASLAVPVLILEYGIHLYDLRAALGDDDQLDADVADVVMQLLPLWMPLVGTPTDAGTSVALGDITVRYDGSGWQPATEAECTIAGPPDALALFALGRIDGDDARLSVTGDDTIAKRFKELFPGP